MLLSANEKIEYKGLGVWPSNSKCFMDVTY
uniref:Uncharacterized protein n=1 Tax=Rhizophora mucronata TaxID=61149 RepID=A0A2P2N256_RHIMU